LELNQNDVAFMIIIIIIIAAIITLLCLFYLPLTTADVIWWSHSPALWQCRHVPFRWLVLEWTSNRSKASPKRCLLSIPPPSQDCFFPLGLGRERLWV